MLKIKYFNVRGQGLSVFRFPMSGYPDFTGLSIPIQNFDYFDAIKYKIHNSGFGPILLRFQLLPYLIQGVIKE